MHNIGILGTTLYNLHATFQVPGVSQVSCVSQLGDPLPETPPCHLPSGHDQHPITTPGHDMG